jgi:uncharacterized YkwD family protein
MKRSFRLILGLLLVFSLVFLPLSGLAEAGNAVCYNLKTGFTSLKQETKLPLAEQLYDQIYRQVKQQLGPWYPAETIERITNELVQELLPRLEKLFSPGHAPQPKPPVPGPDPKPEPKPEQPKPDPEPGPIQPPEKPGASFQLTQDESLMLQLVNQERANNGLSPLKVHRELTELARLKAQDMIRYGYFSHTSPTYGSPFEMMKAAGIRYSYAGENLAGSPTVNRAHTSLMNSPGHRANILNPNYTHVGIGIVDGGNYGKMFVQMFMKPL